MNNQDMITLLRNDPFLRDLPEVYLPLLEECAGMEIFNEGDYLMRQNQPAECFYLLQKGLVSLRINLPAKGMFPVETVVAPAALGWSWLIAPYKWYFDAIAVKPVRTIVVQTPLLIARFEQDRVFGFEMYRRFMEVIVNRLHGVRMQMMDVYAKPEPTRM